MKPLFERSLAIRERTLGPDHTEVAISLNDLASLYYAQGDDASVLPLFERTSESPKRPYAATILTLRCFVSAEPGSLPGAGEVTRIRQQKGR